MTQLRVLEPASEQERAVIRGASGGGGGPGGRVRWVLSYEMSVMPEGRGGQGGPSQGEGGRASGGARGATSDERRSGSRCHGLRKCRSTLTRYAV